MSSSSDITKSFWGWVDSAKDYATQAAEAAKQLTKQAVDLQQQYDYEKATSILMNSVGINTPMTPPDNSVAPKRSNKKKITKDDLKIDLVYVTENVLTMAFPVDPQNNPNNNVGNNIYVVSEYLSKRHRGKYMIWNISEETYDYTLFENQVLEYKFPGHPAPPLGLMFKICTSMESWIDSDVDNVALVHCLTGKGRTAVIVSAFLTWIGEFSSPLEALQYISERRKVPLDQLTIPSQRRYMQYFTNVLDGVKPRPDPLLLRRVIFNGIPIFGDNEQGDDFLGCCPYVQVFKNGKLIGTSTPESSTSDSHGEGEAGAEGKSQLSANGELKWIRSSEGSASFLINCIVQGDVLLRCRHADIHSKARVSMFRAAFHTGYIQSGVLRLTRHQLDGPNTDERFADDFFIDLIFAPVDTHANSSYSSGNDRQENVLNSNNMNIKVGDSVNDSGVVLDSQTTDLFEQMLHKDTRFWESVSARKARARKRKSRKFDLNTSEKFSLFDETLSSIYQEEDEAVDEKSAKRTALSPTSIPSSSHASDLDLIQQLAEFAELSNSDAKISSDLTPINQQQQQPQITLKGDTNLSASAELLALEELEKELGIDLSSTSADNQTASPTVRTQPSVSAVLNHSEGLEENLDDLEKFLESLNTDTK